MIELIMAAISGGVITKLIDYFSKKSERKDENLQEDIRMWIEEFKKDNDALRERNKEKDLEIETHLQDKKKSFERELSLIQQIKELTIEIKDLKAQVKAANDKIQYITNEYEKYHKKPIRE